jgi:pantetheine-phosphate adenylyltransferase
MPISSAGATLVDRLIIGVTTNPSKNPMFTPDERMEMVRREVAGWASTMSRWWASTRC